MIFQNHCEKFGKRGEQLQYKLNQAKRFEILEAGLLDLNCKNVFKFSFEFRSESDQRINVTREKKKRKLDSEKHLFLTNSQN